jgi:hypothetical protein
VTPGELVVAVNFAVTTPLRSGINVTCTVQVAAAAKLAPQVVAPIAKLPTPVPLNANPGCASGDPPVLETVTVLAALATPI